jgi:hypothetical protein
MPLPNFIEMRGIASFPPSPPPPAAFLKISWAELLCTRVDTLAFDLCGLGSWLESGMWESFRIQMKL